MVIPRTVHLIPWKRSLSSGLSARSLVMGEPESTPPTDGIGSIALERIGRYESGQFNEDAAEIVAHSARTDHLYVVNADVGGVDVLDATTPGDPERVDRLVLEDVWADAGEVTNVALRADVPIEGSDGNGRGDGRSTDVLAVAVVAANPQANGRVVFYDATERSPVTSVAVGAAPDMVSFAPDGETVLTADSGEPSEDYDVDPPGTVSLVVYDVSDPMAPRFVQYSNNRNFEVDPIADVEQGDADVSDVGDLGPEGVKFIPASDSPVDEPVVAVGNELGGTTTLYRVRTLGAVDSVTGPPSTSRTVGVRGNSRPGASGVASHGIGRDAIDVCRGRHRRISDRRGGIRFCG